MGGRAKHPTSPPAHGLVRGLAPIELAIRIITCRLSGSVARWAQHVGRAHFALGASKCLAHVLGAKPKLSCSVGRNQFLALLLRVANFAILALPRLSLFKHRVCATPPGEFPTVLHRVTGFRLSDGFHCRFVQSIVVFCVVRTY